MPNGFKLEDVNKSYETPTSVATLSTWYNDEKERAFLDIVFSAVELAADGPIVEIGGGAGLHGQLLKERFGDKYLHTDYSEAMVEKARQFGLASQRVDGLSMPFADNSVSAIFMVGPTTVIRSQELRNQQFAECSRVLKPGGTLIITTSRLGPLKGHHSVGRSDYKALQDVGFEIQRHTCWGAIPGRHWRKGRSLILRRIESIASAARLGLRQIVVAQKS